jgi:cellulose synthase/poly-beta-1,6-N-acetylglucosamine synthase-like glycosyltransferase
MMRRFFEILPGALAWATIILMVVFSRYIPTGVAVFIILFDIYWLLKTVYLSLHLRATFSAMRRNLEVDWFARIADLESVTQAKDLYHLVILPMYDEPYEVVRESFMRLVEAHYPKEKLFVVLGLEEKAGAPALAVGERIEKEFGAAFGKFLITKHPAGLPGEIPGKGSNETWAGLRAKEEIIDPLTIKYENVMVSVFDVDSQVFPEYFSRLTYVFLGAENRMRAIYQPVPLFINNVHEAPALARVVAFSTTFWQMMQQARPERLTSFSSQSIPLRALIDIGFWQKDIVSEDSRIFWQCYLHYHGDFRVEPLMYPIAMDANVASTFWGTMKNLYRQQRRWGWGCENIPYMLEGFRNDLSIARAKKRYWTFNVLEGFHSWATNSLMIFALGWLPLLLGGQHFNYTLISYSLPRITRIIISLSMVGIVSSAILSILLLPPKAGGKKPNLRDYVIHFLQWALMPFTLIIFGAFPGLEAQTRLMLGGRFRLGFWVTPKGRRTETERGSGKR